MPGTESHSEHPHGVEIAHHVIELEELVGYPVAIVSLEGFEDTVRKISQLETHNEQAQHLIAALAHTAATARVDSRDVDDDEAGSQ